MKALTVRRYGGPEVVTMEDMATPEPSATEVLVRIHAALISSSDGVSRSGTPRFARLFFGLTAPKKPVLGYEFAGVVEATGASVTRFAVGDAVFGMSSLSGGTHAEFVAVAEDGIIARSPVGRSAVDMVALVDGPLTAIPFLRDNAHLEAGQRILINGGSGSVGLAAIQYAKSLGAHVTAVTSTGNIALVESAGADTVVDYTHEDFTASDAQYDVVFDAIGKSSWSRCRRLLVPGGIYLTTVPSLGIAGAVLWTRVARGTRAGIAFTGLLPAAAKSRDLQEVRALAESGAFRPVIDSTYDFTDLDAVHAAHARVATGHKTGNVVLVIGET